MESEFLSLGLDIIGLGVFNYSFGSLSQESPVIKAVYGVLKGEGEGGGEGGRVIRVGKRGWGEVRPWCGQGVPWAWHLVRHPPSQHPSVVQHASQVGC
jgi:hypothetical protein